MPRVSVVLPTYNRGHLITGSIQSILSQTFDDFELIIVDDGSIDNTEDVISKFHDKRIKYIKLAKNKGAGAARNKGIEISNGQYIAFHDSDDIWLPSKLEKQIDIFHDLPIEYGVVYTSFHRIKGKRIILIPTPDTLKTEGDIHSELLRGNFVTTQVTVVRKECFKKVGMFDEKLSRLEDWDLWIRISRYYQFKHVNEVLVVSRHSSDSITGHGENRSKASEHILKKHFKEISSDHGTLAWHYFTIGKLACFEEDFVKGRDYLRKAAFTEPYNIKYLFAAISSIGGKSFFRFALKLSSNLKYIKVGSR